LAPATCLNITETITVVPFNTPLVNPIFPNPVPVGFLGELVTCPNNGIELVKIYLCGLTSSYNIQTNIAPAGITFVWEQLTSPPGCGGVVPPANCPNTLPACTWGPAPGATNSPNYLANTAGEYRLTITSTDGCVRTYYFNVYKNILAPTETHRDIICTTNGIITIGAVPAGYEFSLSTPTGVFIPNTWVSGPTANVFNNISVPGNYTVFIQQIGVLNGCVFRVDNIGIAKKDMAVNPTITQPNCFGQLGSIGLGVLNVLPPYTYNLYSGNAVVAANLISTITKTSSAAQPNAHIFSNLTGGTYTWQVTTPDGCNIFNTVTIAVPPVLTATSGVTIPLTPCAPGQITAYPVGGTPPYSYSLSSTFATSQIDSNFTITTAGPYTIYIKDDKGCQTQTTVTINNNPAPVFAPTKVDINCYGDNTGNINFNVSNANGYSLAYSINGLAGPFVPNQPLFSPLVAGTYPLVIQYSLAYPGGTAVCYTDTRVFTVNQPFEALTASGGVSQLACATSTPPGTGIVRITNPQGGTPPYSYSFTNTLPASFGPSNSANIFPSTITIYIKDSKDCIFPMTVTLDPIPAAPTITVTPPVFSCNGNATSTVTVLNPVNTVYDYTYTIVPALVPPHIDSSPVFSNVPCGNPVVTVNYTLKNPPTFSNLLNETFGSGANTTTPGIAAAYCWNGQPYPASTPCGTTPVGFTSPVYCGQYTIEDNQYDVTRAIIPNNCAWFAFRDHTSNGTDPNGRFLAVNIGGAAGANGILYSKKINDVIPGQPIIVEAYVANLLRANLVGGVDPSFSFEVVNNAGVVLAQLPPIPPTPNPLGIPPIPTITRSNTWKLQTVTLTPPGTDTSLTFNIRSGSTQYGGNDALIDDIRVYQLPITCITKRDFPVNIPCNQQFTAQVTGHTEVTCNGANNGTITIAAQNYPAAGYQYNYNGTWLTATTSPFTIQNVAPSPVGGYTVQIRYDATSTGTCSVSIPQTITQPAALVANATGNNATCTTGATITASAVGGNGGNEYLLTGTTNPGGLAVSVGYQTNPIFNNVAPGTYIVTVKDSKGCTDPTDSPINIGVPPNPVASILGSDLCYDSVNGASITVTASGGSGSGYTYGIAIAPALPTVFGGVNVFTVVPGNTYNIVVKDSNGCSSTAISQTIAPQLTVTTVNTKTLDCTVSPNAVVTGTISGGTPPYTITVLPTTGVITYGGGTTFTFSTPTTDTYVFTVKDATTGICSASSTTFVAPKVIPFVNPIKTNVLCNGGNTGSVTLTPSAGVGPFTFNFNNTNPSFSGTPAASATFGSLVAGVSYTYTIKDSKNCPFSDSFTLTQPVAITATASASPYTCLTGLPSISVIASGGTGALEFSIGGAFQPVATPFINVGVGNYTVTVRDANGCLFPITPQVSIQALTPPTDMVFTKSPLVCSVIPAENNTSDVTIITTGGFGALTYTMTIPTVLPVGAVATATGFNNLPPGSYTIRVTDAKGCFYDESFTIDALPTLTAVGIKVNDIKCLGDNNGSGTFTVGGFATTYSYVVTGPGGPFTASNITNPVITLSNLAAGTYNIVVTDNTTTCTANGSFTIAAPAAVLTIGNVPTNISCATNSGSVVINSTGGWGGNTYVLTAPNSVTTTQGGGGTVTFGGLTQTGSYSVTVTDVKGCVKTTSFSLSAPVPPTASINVASDYCYNGAPNTASLQVDVLTSNGGPFQFYLNNVLTATQLGTSYTFSSLVPGPYVIRVVDVLGCPITLPTETIAPQLTATGSVIKELDCTLSPNATIEVVLNGGYPAYEYSVAFNGNPPTVASPVIGSTISFSAPLPGSYVFTIKDTKSCPTTFTQVVAPITNPSFTAIAPVLINCAGESTGTIVLSAITGGFGSYTINVTRNLPLPVTNYGTQLTNLPAGTYTVRVTDSKSCFLDQTVTIGEKPPITFAETIIQFQCTPGSGSTLGSINTNAITGGTGPYNVTLYSQNGGSPINFPSVAVGSGANFSALIPGTYDLEVIDLNGCKAVRNNITLTIIQGLTLDATSVPFTSCTDTPVIIVKVIASPTPPIPAYQFGISNNSNTPPYTNALLPADVGFPLQHTFVGLTPGVAYSFVVYDPVTLCYSFVTATSAEVIVPLTNVVATVKDDYCIAAPGQVNPFTFTVSNYYPTSTAIKYEIYLLGSNVVVDSGTLSPPTATSPQITLTAGTFYIKLIEVNPNPLQNGCSNGSSQFTTTIAPIVPLSVSVSSNTPANCLTPLASVLVQGAGGYGGYTYASAIGVGLPGPYSSTNPLLLDPTVSLNWTIYVKDAKGCVSSIPVTITKDPPPSVIVPTIASNQCTSAGASYSFTVTGSGGVGALTYAITVNPGGVVASPIYQGPTFTVTTPGTYTISVKDGNGCIVPGSNTITIYPPLSLTASFTTQPICNAANGIITAVASGGSGVANYSYELQNGLGAPLATNPSGVFNGFAPGSYIVEVTDGITGCKKPYPFTLDPPVPFTILPTTSPVTCSGGNDGSITVNLTDYSNGPYTYSILPNIGTLSGNVFTGLTAQAYSITVTSARGCPVTLPGVNVLGPTPVVIDPLASSASLFTCGVGNTVNPSTLTVVANGGSGSGYTYSITGVLGSYVSPGVFSIPYTGAASILVYAKDGNGCDAIPIAIPLPIINPIVPSVLLNSKITCLAPESITVSATGGTSSFTYQVLPLGATNVTAVGLPTSGNFTISAPGTYTFLVTDTNTGCTKTIAHTIVPFDTIEANITATTPVSCFGGTNGTLTIAVTGYTGGYAYDIFVQGNPVAVFSGNANTSANPFLIPSTFASGNYYVSVRETDALSTFCDDDSPFQLIGAPTPLNVIAAATNDNCNLNAGQISITSSGGGTAPYSYIYLISPSLAPAVTDTRWTTALTFNAESGSYDVYIKDANNCIITAPYNVSIGLDPTPVISAVTNNLCAAQGAFVIDVTLTTIGVGPYTYSIDGNAFIPVTPIGVPPTFQITGLASGSHTVQIKDFNGCGNTVSVTPILAPFISSGSFTTQPICNTSTGVITMITNGGSGNFSYVLNPPTGGVTQLPVGVFNNVPPGNYSILVTDQTTLCPKTIPVNLAPANPVNLNAPSSTPVTCFNGTDGTITVNVVAIAGETYTYAIVAGPVGFVIPPAQPSNNVFTGLPTGTYDIVVTSNRGCSSSIQQATVGTPNIIAVNPGLTQFRCGVLPNVPSNAVIDASGLAVAGGSSVYVNYQFVNALAPFNVIQTGTNPVYSSANYLGESINVIVTDSKGCKGTTLVPIVINPFVKLDLVNVVASPKITCISPENIVVTVNTIPSVPLTPVTLNYVIVATGPVGNTYTDSNTSGTFNNLPVGDYFITVTNQATGCSIEKRYYVNEPNTFQIKVDKLTDVVCTTGNEGSVNLTYINTQSPPNTLGFSYVIVNNANGAIVDSNVSLTAGPTLVSGLPAGNYTVTATLSGIPNCPVSNGFSIDAPPTPLTVVPTSTPITCASGGNNGVISAVGNGGWTNAPYTYQLESPLNTPVAGYTFALNGTNNTFSPLSQGLYYVRVKDGKGCTTTQSVNLTDPTQIDFTAVPTLANLACNGDQTSVLITVLGGGQGSNYKYEIKGPTANIPNPTNGPQSIPASGFVTVSGIVEGNYDVTITDGWECSRVKQFSVTAPAKVKAQLGTSVVQDCFGAATLIINASGGTPPYFYNVNSVGGTPIQFNLGNPLATSTLIPVNASTIPFSYYVTDSFGCGNVNTGEVTITPLQPFSLSVDKNIINLNCVGDTNATITANATGGLGGYSYTLVSLPSGTTVQGPNNNGNFSGLGLGDYQVVATSISPAGSCTPQTQNVSIVPPANPFTVSYIQENVKCKGDKTGKIILVIRGYSGSGPIQYLISTTLVPNFNNQTFDLQVTQTPPVTTPPTPFDPLVWYATIPELIANTAFNPYALIVQNGTAGCFVPINGIIITEPALSLGSDVPVATNEICLGNNDGTITISNITGGTGPYFITLNYVTTIIAGVVTDTSVYVPINLNNGPGTHVFGTVGGNIDVDTPYLIRIKDNNGCYINYRTYVEKGDNIKPNAIVTFPCVNDVPTVRIEVQNLGNPPNFGFKPTINYIFTINNVVSNTVVATQASSQVNGNIFLSQDFPALLTPGTYNVTAENQFTCSKISANFSILPTDVDLLTLSIDNGGLNEIIANMTNPVTGVLSGSPAYTFSFNGINNGSDNSYIITQSGNYVVKVTDSNGCSITKSKYVPFIPIVIPPVFTPDEDGNNDGWAPQNTSNYKNLITSIYDRYGRKVAELREGQFWDGKYEKKELPTGDYWYVIKVNENDDREYVGHFTLYR
jgi:large repetitive protein